MSDSDDTEVLLLIPPDFFLVNSSDDDSVSNIDGLVERTVVNDLISHVNELENRVAEIERKDTSTLKLNDSSSSLNSSFSANFINTEMNPSSKHLGSTSSLNTSPSRRVTRFNSLPPTPSSSSYRSLAHSASPSRTWGRNHYSPSKVTSRSNRNLSNLSFDNAGKEKLKEKELISEVDLFLDGLRRDASASRGYSGKELFAGGLPPSPNKRDTADGVARLQLDEVDRLLKEVEAEQKNIESRLSSHDAPEVRKIVKKPGEDVGSIPDLGFGVRDQWKDVDKFLETERKDRSQRNESYKQPVNEPIVTSRNQYRLGDNVESIPDLGYGVREAWSAAGASLKERLPLEGETAKEAPIQFQAAHQSEGSPLPKQSPKVFASRRKLDLDFPSRQKPSVEDLGERETSRSLDSLSSGVDQIGSTRNKRDITPPSIAPIQKEDVGPSKTLLSLAELWNDGEKPTMKSAGDTKLLQKYEEERCRRQHCEQLVHALQTKLLESQQKLAVALQVDSDKDAAIAKLQGAWNSLANHWRTVEDQRHYLTKQLQDHKLCSESQIKQMNEKLERYETELSKALDLAHGYKEQSVNAERVHISQMEQLAGKAQELERQLLAATITCTEVQKREETLRAKYNEDHAKLVELKAAMEKATKSLSSHEADIAVLEEEKSALQTRLKEEKARLDMQQQTRDKMRSELEEVKKREKTLQSELKRTTEQMETMKTELHDFYQAQLERVVRDKLKEFQGQLDAAEATLQRELEAKERSVAQLAARQLQHVTEKHKLEVSLLEQKHSEELRLMQLQHAKALRQIQDLENHLAAHEKRSSSLAERLHAVMENQWREALNIISCSPKDGNGQPDISAINSEKSSQAWNEKTKDTAWMLVQQQQQQKKSQSQGSSRSSADDTPFSRDGQITHRNSTPVQQSQPQGQAVESEELRRYIKMLLDRTPGNPVSSTPEDPQQGLKPSGNVTSTLQLKPPWK
ncbi:Centrobin [Frankliniella fusca]|uniref:Centrobin n=1 Tax=Frankliniella fusca TaxID=407009 RepID=A0AAE1HQ70_9NEOP|nr:Centrobin [Frankliniella fusca]